MLLWTLVTVAHADQCAWNTPAHAKSAAEILKVGTEFAEWCEPCGDAKPKLDIVREVSVATVGETLREVSVNGRPIDLAYVFVRLKPTDPSFANLAARVSCPTTGVSPTLVPPPRASSPSPRPVPAPR